MQSIPSYDVDDGDLSGISYEHRNHQENLIKRKPLALDTRVRAESVASDVWSEKRSLTTTAWKTKWNRVGPLLGLAALTVTIMSIPIAFGILRASDGDLVSAWRYSPNVYLAIMTSITGKATSLAALQGAMIAWWLRAMRGTTLEQLHFDWSMGQNIWDALIAGRRINMIAIACICGTIAAIDAPLLQRASSVVSRSPNTEVMLDVNLVPQIPGYYSGQTSYDGTGKNGSPEVQMTDPNPDFYRVMMTWMNNETIPPIVSGCPGTCSVTVRAPMIATWNCTETSKYINYTEGLPGNYSWADITQNPALANRTAFYTNIWLIYNSTEREFLPYWIGMSDQETTDTCAGNYVEKYCLAASAIGEYDLLVRDNETSFAQGTAQPRFVAWSNNTAMNNETSVRYNLSDVPELLYQHNYNSTFSGIAFGLSARYETTVQFIPIGWPWHPNIYGNIDQWMFSHVKDYAAFNRGNACIPAWIDPTDDLLASMNELAFRIGVHTAQPEYRETLLSNQYNPLDPGIEISYKASGIFVSRVNVFEADYLFFFGAAIIQLACVLVIMYTFYGWWRLGRAVTFSPLEMTNAFEAPMLMSMNSNADADNIARTLGRYRVKYGAVGSFVHEVDGLEAEKLALTDRVDVQEPRKGMTFRS